MYHFIISSFNKSVQKKQYLQGVEDVMSRKDVDGVRLKCVGKTKALKSRAL
jgi:hypothetical protein